MFSNPADAQYPNEATKRVATSVQGPYLLAKSIRSGRRPKFLGHPVISQAPSVLL